MKFRMYGIPNCDTVKKARRFLEKNNIDYEFIDFKKVPPRVDDVKRWETHFGGLPANTKGPTFRKIKDNYENATDAQKLKLLIENSSAIKRPVLERGAKVICIGYDETVYKNLT